MPHRGRARLRRAAPLVKARESRDQRLEDGLALHARFGELLDVIAGVHVNTDDVQVDVDGINSQTQLQVRPARLHEIIARATAILGRYPDG
jgi:uncharacterized membrane-anchored protein